MMPRGFALRTRGCGYSWWREDAEVAGLRAERDADRELIRRLGLRLAELERRLDMDSSDSGTPSSKERIGAKEARRARQQSERERSKDRSPGGQPGHQGKGPQRDPDPGERRTCRRRRSAGPAGQAWTGRSRPGSRGGRRSSTWRPSGR